MYHETLFVHLNGTNVHHFSLPSIAHSNVLQMLILFQMELMNLFRHIKYPLARPKQLGVHEHSTNIPMKVARSKFLFG